jgi:hypothetical protein
MDVAYEQINYSLRLLNPSQLKKTGGSKKASRRIEERNAK